MKPKKVKEEAYHATPGARTPTQTDAPPDGGPQEDPNSEEAKQKKKQLELLQKKWISGMSQEQGAVPAVGEDFSILSGKAGTDDASVTGRTATAERGEHLPTAQTPTQQPQVDMEELRDFIRNTIRLEIDRAVRELKREVDETSESSKKEILDELKMELERIRNEVELAQPKHKSRGLFDRF
jgi:hypothetical protein